jgi:hypothetical protein
MFLLRGKRRTLVKADKRLVQSPPLGKAQPGVRHYSAVKLRKLARLAEAIVVWIRKVIKLRRGRACCARELAEWPQSHGE